MFLGTKGAHGINDISIRLIITGVRLKIDRCTKSPRTVGGSANTALKLDTLCRSGNIGHVHPVHALRLTVVVRYSINSDVDPGGIASANSNAGISYACPCIRSSDHRGSPIEEHRKVLAKILFLNGLAIDIRERRWRFFIGPRGFDDHFISNGRTFFQHNFQRCIAGQVHRFRFLLITQESHQQNMFAFRKFVEPKPAEFICHRRCFISFRLDGGARQRPVVLCVANCSCDGELRLCTQHLHKQ